jgi:PAS domain S-box-containing protein
MPSSKDTVERDLLPFERVLKTLIFIVSVACVLSIASMLTTNADNIAKRVTSVVVLLVIVVAVHWQLKRSVHSAAKIFVVGMWLAVSASTFMLAGIHSVNFVMFPMLVALAGWVLGERWLQGVFAATIVLIGFLAAGENAGLLVPTARANPFVVAVTLASVVVTTTYLITMVYRSLIRGRDRAMDLAGELKEKNRALTQREGDLQMILDHVPSAIASFDADSRLRWANTRYAAMFGVPPGQLVGKHINDYVPADALAFLQPHWNRCLQGERISYRRTNRDPGSGALRILDVALVPELEQGGVSGLFAQLIDVTDKVAADEEIRELNSTLELRVQERTAALEAAMETLRQAQEELARSETQAALGTIVASVSHELSTPLGNSLMTAGTLMDHSRQFQQSLDAGNLRRSELSAFVAQVNDGNSLLLRNLQRAVELLRNFRQVVNDSASEQRRVFDLAGLVAEVLETLTPSLKRYPHRIEQHIAAGIRMDSFPGALGQVIINLTNNAYLHAFDGRSDGVLSISALLQGDYVLLQFEDNGVGISPAHLERLFEPFFSTKHGKGGTGLGMGIVDNLVRKSLGGSIAVTSTEGKGSYFELSLPLVAPAPEADGI